MGRPNRLKSVLRVFALLLPALLPSWRFFDWIAPSPRVEFRYGTKPWQECDRRPSSRSYQDVIKWLFFNPDWNDYLFLSSCAERLAKTPTDHSEVEIIKHIIRYYPSQGDELQFRLRFLTQDNSQIAFQSQKHQVSAYHDV